MTYLVLARKWRPQTFSQVIGQDHVTKALENAISCGRIAHAFLFSGTRGTGKTSVARILAKALNCEIGPTITPCNKCSICREITDGSTVDVYEIDGASNRGIDEIRELRENIKYLPARCRYKIFIIDEVHMLTPEAFNALLKTLEEPPGHVIFIFATTEPHKIPITILSRCQRYDFRRLPLEDITGQLSMIAREEDIKLSDRCLRFIARQAEGGMRDALSLLDRLASYGDKEVTEDRIGAILGLAAQNEILKMAKALLEHDLASGLRIIDTIYNHGLDLKRFYADLVEAIRNIIVLKTCNGPARLANLTIEEADELRMLAQEKSNETVYQYFQLLMQGWDELKRSANPKLSLEMILMRASLLKDLVPIQEILHKISILANGERSDGKHLNGIENIPETKPLLADKPPIATDAPEANEAFVSFVRSKSLPLASVLQQCQDLSLRDGVLELEFAGNSFCDLLTKTEYHNKLSELCREFYQRDIRINITSKPVMPCSHNESNSGSLRKEILEHPMVQETINIFGAHVEEIETEKH